MDLAAISGKIVDFLKKYRYVVLVLVLGIGLMLLPDGKKDTAAQPESTASAPVPTDPTEELAKILSQIKGAGKVQVMLCVAAGEKTVYQTDQESTTSDTGQTIRVDTVIVSDSDRTQQGLIQQIVAPEYRGAIVVCQGAEDPAVRLAIVEAVTNATGLGADRISVLKMK